MDTFKRYLPVLLLVLIFGAAFQLPNSVSPQLKAIQSQLSGLEFDITGLKSEISRLKPRKFYLTRDRYDGAHALTACAGGYHMASLWEILDPSNLRYNRELGLTLDDSGFGPPTSALSPGWIRTGNFTSDSGSPGTPNCSAWTSADVGNSGTTVLLNRSWGDPAQMSDPWRAVTNSCNSLPRVWCVED